MCGEGRWLRKGGRAFLRREARLGGSGDGFSYRPAPRPFILGVAGPWAGGLLDGLLLLAR